MNSIKYMWKFIAWITIAVLLNTLLDAIDHGKGKEDLNELWHIVKMLNFFAVSFAGAYFVLPHSAWKTILERLKINIRWLVLLAIGLWFLWEGSYKLIRLVFDIWGIPPWF